MVLSRNQNGPVIPARFAMQTRFHREGHMRLIKMLGLAMVVAAAAMVIVGTGTASAVLCKVKENPCAAANQYPVPTTILSVEPEN